jgi:hypothetical protein
VAKHKRRNSRGPKPAKVVIETSPHVYKDPFFSAHPRRSNITVSCEHGTTTRGATAERLTKLAGDRNRSKVMIIHKYTFRCGCIP